MAVVSTIVVAANLWRELHSERQANAGLRTQLEAQIAQARASIRVQQERERVLRAMRGERN